MKEFQVIQEVAPMVRGIFGVVQEVTPMIYGNFELVQEVVLFEVRGAFILVQEVEQPQETIRIQRARN